MADFADSTALVVDVELLAPIAAGRLSPALPALEQLLESNLYAVCDLVAGRAARASSARSTARSTHASATPCATSSAGRRRRRDVNESLSRSGPRTRRDPRVCVRAQRQFSHHAGRTRGASASRK